jgi:hypothetical protein
VRRYALALIVGVLMVGAAAAGYWAFNRAADFPERPPSERPELLLLTSLPIVFPESFSLDGGSTPVLQALRRRYRVVPVGVADGESLRGHQLLLMAQPRAQPAEALVELDAWVRGGGRVLLLADPSLHWPSERPLGDPLRPPLAFADTGLLAHWGLELGAPGEVTATAGNCTVWEERLTARCAIGKGRVIVVADADFLDAPDAKSRGVALLLSQLADLER